jgi:hypothetical protein
MCSASHGTSRAMLLLQDVDVSPPVPVQSAHRMRQRVHPSAPMSAEESRIILWMRDFDASLPAAACLSDVSVCEAMCWLEDGHEHPAGKHVRFVRILASLGVKMPEREDARRTPRPLTGGGGRHGCGYHHKLNGHVNGHAVNGSNGHAQLTRFTDL